MLDFALRSAQGHLSLSHIRGLHKQMGGLAEVGLLWASSAPDLSALLPNRPPWRSAPHVLNLSWTGSCGLWGRPITPAASLVWCATVALMASLSQWMPPARSTALRTSTGNLLHDAQYVVGPSCLSQVRRRLCELLLWIAVFTLAVTSARSVGCCSLLRVSVRAATRWMGTSCVRPAVPGASRSSQLPSPLTAESF